jgi:nucleoid DNA-binding protein
MGKLTIQEIAKVLVDKNGLDQTTANRFSTEMFALILERLQQGEQVKVKGLGTWKIIDVDARESVSVRTGERVVIDGHSKVTFTPDATMKELVNKPFSQFETVVLNDGVEFDDMKNESVDDDQRDESPEEDVAAVQSASLGQEPEPVRLNDIVEPSEAQPAFQETAEEQLEEEPASEELAFEDEDNGRHWVKWLFGGVGVLALMAVSAWAGYYYGSQQLSALPVDTIVVRDTVLITPKDTVEKALAPQVAEEQKPILVQKADKKTAIEPKATPLNQEMQDQYAAKDERVRLGAYRIVGLDHEVKVQPGQTFYSICRGNLGPDMECYVEVYNDLPRNPNIKVGQTIKIPKVQLKKRRRQ